MPKCYILNLVTFGPVVSEEKSFESVDRRRTDDRGFPSYELKKIPRVFNDNLFQDSVTGSSDNHPKTVIKGSFSKVPGCIFSGETTNYPILKKYQLLLI